MANIKEVAKEAGVSVATVSRVINNSPKISASSFNAVHAAMKKLNYRPSATARALAFRKSNGIGVIIGDVSGPFFGSLLKSVDKVAIENQKHILIRNGYHNADSERAALELLIDSDCDAIILHSKGLCDQELIDYSKKIKGLVLINRLVPEIASRCIYLDNKLGAYIGTCHLINQGHKNIACIASSEDIEDTRDRINGYLQALEDNNIQLSSSYIEYGESNVMGGELAMTNLLSKSLDITAVVTYNDYMAAGALQALVTNDISVPNSVSIVGFDDDVITRFVQPNLTTVRYPIALMAERATRLALKLSQGGSIEDESTSFAPTLVKRQSVTQCALA